MADQLDVKTPVLLKLDVQGYEKQVLLGARDFVKEYVDHIVFETSFVPLYADQPLFDEMHGFVKELGYDFVGPVGFHQGKDLAIIEMDVLYRRSNSK